MPATDEPLIAGWNESLAFWSVAGLSRDVIDGGGVDGTVCEITDRELVESELQPGEQVSDYWDSYVVTRRIHDRSTTEVRFCGVPSIHSLNWESTRVDY